MNLVRIELQGFKSFVDRTILTFDQGITAILGPNGCGKSNIVDAVRWVLGEQSPKTLRGDSMQDVIFKGTTKRKPVGLCEVALTFDNGSRRLPIDYDEVCIRRRVTRDGGSDYFLNGSLCRLKDIHDLLWDSGVGNTAYSIIEHAMINQVLNEHNQELRRIIEEGSGITKYKARRRETQRKLERTQQDLLRLNDIVEEIGREVRSLQRQVGKARRHQRLFHQIKALDVLVADRRRGQLDREEADGRRRLQELAAEAEKDAGELAALRARLEEVRPELDERQAERSQLEESLQAYEEELQEAERAVLLQEHRIGEHERRLEESQEAVLRTTRRQEEVRGQIADLEGRLRETEVEIAGLQEQLQAREEELRLRQERLAADREDLDRATQLSLEFIQGDAERQGRRRELEIKLENRRERLAGLERERERLERGQDEAAARLAQLAEDRDRLTATRRERLEELAATERRLGELEAEAETVREAVGRQAARREALGSRHDLLRRMQEEYRGYGEGARAVLQAHAGEARVRGSLADGLRVPEELVPAVEVLLSDLLDAVVVDGVDTALDLARELRDGGGGRASFLADLAAAGSDEAQDPGPDAGPAQGRPALELVGGDLTRTPHLRRLLAATWIFPDDDAARRAAREHAGRPWLFLSPGGLLLSGDGLVRGGRAGEAGTGLLGRDREIEKLAGEIAELERRLAAERRREEDNRAAIAAARQALLHGRGEMEILEGDLRQVHVQIAQQGGERDAAARRLQEIAAEMEAPRTGIAELSGQLEAMGDELALSGRQRDDSVVRRDDLRRAVGEAEAARDELRGEVEGLRLQGQRREGLRRETAAALGHLRESLAEMGARLEGLAQEIEHARQAREELRVQLAEQRERHADGLEERERRRRLVRAAAEAIQAVHQQTAGWHDRITEIEGQRQGCRDRMHEIETGLATLDVRRRNLVERLEEQYGGRFVDLVRGLDPEHLPRELEREEGVFQVEQAQRLLSERKESLARLGPVNQLALEEYEAKRERLDFLQKQQADVQKAKEDLETAIARINRTARKLFADTFEQVRRNFISVFEVLFEGGRADLELLRTDDPLESNIHILAQPRGKVVNHVTLLSGGERCLTALSLLFAVYLVKPSPFCILDEIDAPLDDANIGRFVRMLREFSRNTQFLVVTHNKLTMETANHLYGVTMMEQGVSSIVSVSFGDVADTQSDAELGRAIADRRRAVDRRAPAPADAPAAAVATAGADGDGDGGGDDEDRGEGGDDDGAGDDRGPDGGDEGVRDDGPGGNGGGARGAGRTAAEGSGADGGPDRPRAGEAEQ